MILDEPPQGESVEVLWRYVRDLTKLVNALANMEVQGPHLNGKVESTIDHAKIVINDTNV